MPLTGRLRRRREREIITLGMRRDQPDTGTWHGAARAGAIARYALARIALGGVIAALALVVLDEPAGRPALPPMHQTELLPAVRSAGCTLRHARPHERVLPPVDGRRGPSARAAFYRTSPPVGRLTAAVRRGVIVIYYVPRLGDGRLRQLEALQTVVPGGTIVAPDTTGMRYAVAVAAYRRLLACPRFTDAAIDAIRLFRGRHIGTGPDV